MVNEVDYSERQLDLFTLCESEQESRGSLFGRTSWGHLLATKAMIFEPCSKKSDAPKFLYLQMVDGRGGGWLTCRSVKSRGECLTLNTGESPNEENASSLSQILEKPEGVQEKYYLSARACKGILARAERRGKPLPTELKTALERQSNMQ